MIANHDVMPGSLQRMVRQRVVCDKNKMSHKSKWLLLVKSDTNSERKKQLSPLQSENLQPETMTKSALPKHDAQHRMACRL